ncbi:carboxylate--amine ligase/circularly permuted type 2 ATP-grasp protein [Actinomadura flavalba]|uniref:carboxylate--amine ligase/circularly permuted type 2 ATP-grasp protein n=1 Tax=Actinomadura flavalba TaxID=1120938 RepID=UPI0003A96B0F|nr:carboxylate--amine ligase/circularly permuted type 2 ATP-grasp protein [Actinomadura flavalba]
MIGDRAEVMAVGVEEEFHTVDLDTHRLLPKAGSLLGELPGDRFGQELHRSVLETNSRPFVRLIDLAEDLTALRREAIGAAREKGLGIVAAGTVPVADPAALQITPDPRYENMLEEYQVLAREQLICGAQVHVDVGGRENAIAIAHRLAPRLPALLALSASSPYWLGSDTGYASYRTVLWSRWPTAGPIGAFDSIEEYDALIADLVASGVITDPGMIYYDVRPSAHVPTIELRVPDACPRVEDVALLAGLFRAMVLEELDAVRDGLPPHTLRPEQLRAMTWRAARDGLEGALIDPSDGRPVPAPKAIRGLLNDLRPSLERTGDWELVAELADNVLADGGSVARQRAAYIEGGFGRVVELLVAETAAGTEWSPGTGPARTEVNAMLSDYDASADEAVVFDGSARGPYGLLMTALDRVGVEGLREREQLRDEVQRHLGMTFRVDADSPERLFPVDLVPRVIASQDWDLLDAGMVQRVRALEAFLHDAYGDRQAVADEVVPSWVVDESPGLRDDGRIVPRSSVRCAVAGIDLVRDDAGRWAVLEDNLRVPSGIGYALANRWLSTHVLSDLRRALPTPTPSRIIGTLRGALPGALAVVTLGERDSAFFEHRLLAREMNVPLLTPGDLRVEPDGVYAGDDRIETIYRRIEEDELFGARGADGKVLGPGLLDAVARGELHFANAPGNGVGDDKALYAFVPQLIRYYLNEDAILENVPTYLCRVPERREEVLERIADLVVKPVDGHGGAGVLIGPDATTAELEKARAAIQENPGGWIAQEVVHLSTHPTFVDGRLRPRVVDLRAFVVQGAATETLPLALTRVAPEGSRVVNSSRGGGSKDTWLVR